MRHLLMAACLVLGCARSGAVAPTSSPNATPAPAHAAHEPEPEAKPEPLAQARAILEASGIGGGFLYGDDFDVLAREGMTPALATAALEVLAARCKDVRTPTCGHVGRDNQLRFVLLEWLQERGDLSAASVLLRLDHFGDYRARRVLTAALTRRMQAELGPCAPPTDAEIAAVRATLGSFVVIDHRRGRLEGRAATPDELDDLAYFLAAVADSGPGVGEVDPPVRSGVGLTEARQREHARDFEAFEHARETGDSALTVQVGSDYLRELGYPGPIDQSQETVMYWGGARFSYVMRDIALAAELEDQPQLAASLYRRAQPGGGACGTTTANRFTAQLEGLVRSEEARGNCRAVVVERLINRSEDAYGPGRLSDAGYDVARLYRGALLTRHREREPARVEAAIERAPADVREAGLARWVAKGPEAWEAKIWAVEGLVNVAGRSGMETVLSLADHIDPVLRTRVISAVGSAARRGYMGTCEGVLTLSNVHWIGRWRPTVRSFGSDCDTWLDDAEADALAQWLLPYLRDPAPGVKETTAEALGEIAAPSARRPLARLVSRAQRAEGRCRSRGDDACVERQRSVQRQAQRALEAMNELDESVERDEGRG